MIVLCVCLIVGFRYKIIDEGTEHYLTTNVCMTAVYDKGNSHCQIDLFDVCYL